MGYLLENMEKIDVQGTYDALQEAKAELARFQSKAQTELADTENRANNAEVERDHAQAELTRLKALLAKHGIAEE